MFLQNLRAKVGARLNGDSEAGFTLIELLVVMLILARSRRTLGDRRSGRISTTLVVATIIASVALPIAYLLR